MTEMYLENGVGGVEMRGAAGWVGWGGGVRVTQLLTVHALKKI